MDAISSYLLLGFEGELFITLGLGTAAASGDGIFECIGFEQVGFETNCPENTGGGTSRRDKAIARRLLGKVIRFSDLDERERIEALAAIKTRPFTPLEQAAVNLSQADEDEQDDDELILMALMRILH